MGMTSSAPGAQPRAADGTGALAFTSVRGRTVVASMTSHAPLKLVATHNHGAGAWVFVANFGGGLVDGDRLRLHARVGAGALALLGTQAQTKAYRGATSQHFELDVDEGATLAVVPDPVACFAGASYRQESLVRLAPGASLVFVDGMTCGRAARAERWDFARYATRTRVERSGKPLVVDALVLDPAHGGALVERMGRFEALATVIAIGDAALPVVGAMARAAATAPLGARADLVQSFSPLPAGSAHDGADARSGAREEPAGAIARVAGVSVERVAHAVRGYLGALPGLFGDDPFARKW